MKRCVAWILASALSACAAPPARQPPMGVPTAQVNDRLTSDDDGSNARVFAVRAIDGVAIRNAVDSQQVLRGVGGIAGANVLPWLVARPIEAKTASFQLAGRFVTRAPIEALVRDVRGQGQTIDATIVFTPLADHVYRVDGILSPTESGIWIEDFETGEIVTPKISSPPR